MGPPLSEFLSEHRQALIDRWAAAVTRENTPEPMSHVALVDELPRFVDDLIAALHPHALPLPSPGSNAFEHGSQRLELGFNVREVVREYGILHRCIIELASENDLVISTREQTVLVRVVTDGIASAVSQYVHDRDTEQRRQMSEHLGFIAHEVRNPLSAARIALGLLQKRELAAGGKVVERLARTLRRTNEVIDNTLNHATLALGVTPRLEPLRVREVLDEILDDFTAEAERKGIKIALEVAGDPTIHGDGRLLRSAISNLLQNALKFTRPETTVQLRARRIDKNVAIEVEDECGGLPPGRAEDLFKPLVQRSEDQTGFGLGLAIAQQAAQAHGGALGVRDLPGQGCVFTLDVPEHPDAKIR